MKKIILAGLLATSLAAWADDTQVFKNSDFSSGVSEWEGDIHTAGSAVDDSGATTGGVVKLRDWWTKVSQDFETKSGTYILTIKYTVTPDFSLSKKRDDYANVTGQLGLTSMLGFNGQVGKLLLLVIDLDAWKYYDWEISPSTDATKVQTAHATVRLSASDDQNKGFYLCFPPGKGTVNIQSITLTPK